MKTLQLVLTRSTTSDFTGRPAGVPFQEGYVVDLWWHRETAAAGELARTFHGRLSIPQDGIHAALAGRELLDQGAALMGIRVVFAGDVPAVAPDPRLRKFRKVFGILKLLGATE